MDDAATPDETAVEQPEAEESKFIDWLAQHRNGLLDVDLADSFKAVVNAVRATGKPGTVTLVLKVEPTKGEMLAVSDTISTKEPVANEARLYYLDFDGSLTRDNPLQPKLIIPPSPSEQ